MDSGDERPSGSRRAQWLATAFVSGGVVMTLELVAFRLYAPYFGYSTYVWGSMIGVVMVALSAGYALGGWSADRRRTDVALYAMILAAGVWQSFVLLALTPMMSRFGRMDAMLGPLVATSVIFAPPMTLLAMTGPYVTRLLARGDRVGTTAGNVYAISTMGSIVGVFGTSFGLVPWLGTRATLMTACALSLGIGAIGLAARRSRVAAIVIVPLITLTRAPALGWSAHAVWLGESTYNLVRVVRTEGGLALALNDARTFQSVSTGAKRFTGHYYDYFALGPLLVPTRRVLVLGMGAGTSIGLTRVTAPDATIDAVEIDPLVVEAARRFFALEPGPRLRVHVADARSWVRTSRERFDLVEMDLFQGGLYQPFYLVTEEAFRDIASRMTPEAVLMWNVYDRSPEGILLATLAATMLRVFPTVASIRAGRNNHIVLAFPRSRSIAELRAALRGAEGDVDVRDLARDAADELRELRPPAGTRVLTDDCAPIEALTRAMLATSARP